MRILSIFALVSVAELFAQNRGTIQGLIKDEKGRAQQGGRVVAVLTPTRLENYTPWQGFALSDRDGKYQLSGVPEGKIEICVDWPGRDYVDPCLWGSPSAVANIVGVSGSVNLDLPLLPGKPVQFRLDDPDGYLERHDGKTRGAVLEVALLTERRNYIVAAPTATQPKGARQFQAIVPAGAKWRIRVTSPFFDLESKTESLRPLAVEMDQDQTVLESEKDKTIQVNVKGLKPDAGK
jgi:hypothetical protein